MNQSTVGRIRLAAVAAILIGSGLASSVASATTEAPSADAPIVEPLPDEAQAPATAASAAEPSSEPAPPEPVGNPPVSSDEAIVNDPSADVAPSDEPVMVEVPDEPVVDDPVLDDPVIDDPVIDGAVQEDGAEQPDPNRPDSAGSEATGSDSAEPIEESGDGGDAAVPNGVEPNGAVQEGGAEQPDPDRPGSAGSEASGSEPAEPVEEGGDGPDESGDDHGEGGDDHGEGGDDHGEGDDHSGSGGDHSGSGGDGTPYRMTFSVRWYTASGEQVSQLDPQWTSGFKLEAASQTGSGQATAATCTYSVSGDDLTCQFQSPGHGGVVDGMIVPAKPTATYTVSVSIGADGPNRWSISNANGGPYSARALCPRGDHDDHALGEDSGGGGGAFYCMHTVEMHQLEAVVPPEEIPPPETEPVPVVPPEEIPPPETEPGPVVPPEEIPPPTAVSPTTATPSVPVTQNTLPSTGQEVSVMLGLGALMIAVGALLLAQTRRGRVDGLPSTPD